MAYENERKKLYGRDIMGNRQKAAVALEYEAGEKAPKVIAAGKGYIAEKIIEKAKEDIYVHKDPKLAKSLADIDIGEYIPPELYKVVAEVLAFVDTMDKIKGKTFDSKKRWGVEK